MRVGFDVSQTGTEKAGCGYMADSLVQALTEVDRENAYILYPTFGDCYWDSQGPAATRRIDRSGVQVGLTHESLADAGRFWRSPPPDLERQLGEPDIVHANNFFCPSGLRAARLVYTLYDLSFLEHPGWTTEHNRQVCFDGVFRASVEADLILAISDFSRRHFLRAFPHYPADRTAVVYLGSRFDPSKTERMEAPSNPEVVPGDYFLFVGTLEPRKNPSRLIRAYARYVERCEDAPKRLVLAGGRGWLTGSLSEEIKSSGVASLIDRLGYIEDAVLSWLYRNCHAFVYPSRFEGFGLPVLEAMAHGAAVITAATSALPEVIGDAGILIDPEDEIGLAEALLAVARDEPRCRRLRQRARQRAAQFGWQRTAKTVLAHYRAVVEREKYVAAPVFESPRWPTSE